MDKEITEYKFKKRYKNITYDRVRENYVYIGTQESYRLPPVRLYTGVKTSNTLSQKTLEGIINKK